MDPSGPRQAAHSALERRDLAGSQLALFVTPTRPRAPSRSRMSIRRETENAGCPSCAGCSQRPHHDPTGLELVKHLTRLYNGYRIRMFDRMGVRSGRVLREAERQVRIRAPEFSLDKLTLETAPLIFELIETTVACSPFYLRSSLRRDACRLLAEFYEQQYSSLESLGELSRLEDVYYRLKG